MMTITITITIRITILYNNMIIEMTQRKKETYKLIISKVLKIMMMFVDDGSLVIKSITLK